MRIEILHYRCEDDACDVTVFIDGQKASTLVDVTVDVEDIDPGRGYDGDDWLESREHATSRPERSEAFRAAIDDGYGIGLESKYVTEPKHDGWRHTAQ